MAKENANLCWCEVPLSYIQQYNHRAKAFWSTFHPTPTIMNYSGAIFTVKDRPPRSHLKCQMAVNTASSFWRATQLCFVECHAVTGHYFLSLFSHEWSSLSGINWSVQSGGVYTRTSICVHCRGQIGLWHSSIYARSDQWHSRCPEQIFENRTRLRAVKSPWVLQDTLIFNACCLFSTVHLPTTLCPR